MGGAIWLKFPLISNIGGGGCGSTNNSTTATSITTYADLQVAGQNQNTQVGYILINNM